VKTLSPQIVYFGGLRSYKRPEHALLVLKEVIAHRSDVSLVVVGSGPMVERLKLTARDLGISAQVSFVGYVDDNELASTISRSWMNIHCSTSEGWGLSVVEAAVAGVPTAAYAVPGITNTIRDGVTGLLVGDGDVYALAQASIEILDHSEEWWQRCIGSRGAWDWETTATMWERHLERVSNMNSI
jgi:glycosyltransferase involved in cell wall biosynthesis